MAAALQLASLVYIVGALFQGIGYQPVMLMIIGLQIGLHSYCRRIDSAVQGRVAPSRNCRRHARRDKGRFPRSRSGRLIRPFERLQARPSCVMKRKRKPHA